MTIICLLTNSNSMAIHKILIFTTLVFLSFTSMTVADDNDYQENYSYHPSAEAMILDGLVYRPLALASTLIGTGIFLATLPFSLTGGNVDQAGYTLVIEPANMTFNRCLGCLPQYQGGYYSE